MDGVTRRPMPATDRLRIHGPVQGAQTNSYHRLKVAAGLAAVVVVVAIFARVVL